MTKHFGLWLCGRARGVAEGLNITGLDVGRWKNVLAALDFDILERYYFYFSRIRADCFGR